MSAASEALAGVVAAGGGMRSMVTRVAIVAVLGVCVAAAGAVLWHHYTDLVNSKALLTGQVSGLQADVARESARADALADAIGTWEAAAEEQARALDRMTAVQEKTAAQQQELKNVLSQHDLAALAARKPGLIEGRINAGTRDAFRLLERSTKAGDTGQRGAHPTATDAAPPATTVP